MKTHTSYPVHRFNGMVNLMNSPQKRNTMEKIVDHPLNQIYQEKGNDKLR